MKQFFIGIFAGLVLIYFYMIFTTLMQVHADTCVTYQSFGAGWNKCTHKPVTYQSPTPVPTKSPTPSCSPTPPPKICNSDHLCVSPTPQPTSEVTETPTPTPTIPVSINTSSGGSGGSSASIQGSTTNAPGAATCNVPYSKPILVSWALGPVPNSVTYTWWPSTAQGIQGQSITYGPSPQDIQHYGVFLPATSSSYTIKDLTFPVVWAEVWALKNGCAEISNPLDP